MPGSVSGGRQQRVSQTVASRFSSVMSLTSTPASSSAVSDVGSGEEMRSLDCNLAALCEHVQAEGWNVGSFSDIVVQAMGSTYYLHRLILSRSTYFRNMLQGSWKEAGAPEVKLHIDDENVNGEAVAIALAYLYGHHPKLTDSNAFRVLAAASFLDLQDLCAICTDFIISELWTENFLVYQAFAESQDYGIHGERVRKACWGYLCRGGAVELKEILPKLSTQTLSTLLTSDELWVPSECRRFELAINVLISRGALLEIGHSQVDATTESCGESVSFSYLSKDWKDDADELSEDKNKLSCLSQSGTTPQDGGVKGEGRIAIHKILMELADSVVDIYDDNSSSLKREQGGPTQQIGVVYAYRNEKPGSPNKSQMEVEINNICRPLLDSRKSIEANTGREACSSHGGQVNHFFDSQTGCYEMGKFRDKPQNCSSSQFPISSSDRSSPNQWPRDGTYCVPAWGGRVVERRQLKAYLNQSDWKCSEDWDAFLGVFEDGGILYCHMAFEELLDGRRQLEELGFPCKAVSDGLWLQTLLKQHVLTVSAETCKACGLFRTSCPCRQSYSYPHGRAPTNFYRDDQERNVGTSGGGSFHGTDGQPGITAAPVQGRVHVRAAADGLAGIGRGPTFGPPGGTWPPSRFMFSRIPLGSFGGRSSQQTLANDQPDARLDFKGMEMPVHSVDGLPSVVGLSQGSSSGVPIHSDQGGNPEESQFSARIVGDAGDATSSSGLSSQKVDSLDHTLGHEWETNESSSITLDLDTPLRTFPPFRFGVEFDNVHRLADGQSRHSSEAFYAGSLWKVSVQAFHDEDPQGRRTLGLFLHRRRADNMDSHHKVYLYTDTREKVTARYQLICPAKREVMIFGSLTQAGTLLPKAPKGWGWRTAFLFDELADLLQGGSLRVAAVVQLV